MNARRLEEIFEECVSAYLEGRRSIQESLQLYPAYAAELAPLLQTAVQFNDSFSKITPPAHVQNRVRARFLSDARARRQVRSLTRSQRRSGLFAGLWQQHRFGFAGAAGAVAVLVIAVGSAAVLTGGGSAGGPGSVGNFTTAPATQHATPARVTTITNKATDIRNQAASGAPIKPQDIEELVAATNDLRNASPGEVEQASAQIEQALRQADLVLSQVAAAQPALAPQAQKAQDTVRGVAGDLLDVDLTAPVRTTVATPTPVPTAETPAPTQKATPEPTGSTAEPTPAPTDTPVPTPTPERGLPGENP